MARIVIFGNTSGGKSTLARQLAQSRNIPHIEIDKLYWQSDWSITPPDIYEQQHAAIIAGAEWIIDGGGDLATTQARAERATDIILIDLPVWMHFWLAAERHAAWLQGRLEYPPGGIHTAPPGRRLFEIIWEVSENWMPVLRDLCHTYEAQGKNVVRLTSLEAIDAFTQQG